MAAHQPVEQPHDDPPDDFVLKFSQVIQTAVIRKGGDRCPIGKLLPKRFMEESKYKR